MKIAKVFYTIAEDIFVFTMGPEGKSARKAPGGSPIQQATPCQRQTDASCRGLHLFFIKPSRFYRCGFPASVFALHFAASSRSTFSTNAAGRVENACGGSGGAKGGDSRFSITIISRHCPNL